MSVRKKSLPLWCMKENNTLSKKLLAVVSDYPFLVRYVFTEVLDHLGGVMVECPLPVASLIPSQVIPNNLILIIGFPSLTQRSQGL